MEALLKVKNFPPRGSSPVWVAAVLATALMTLAGVLTGVDSPAGTTPQNSVGVAGGPRQPLSAGHRGMVTAVDALQRAAQQAEVGMPPGIVRAVGTHFVADGQPWRFLGFNDYKLTSRTYAAGYTCGGQHPDSEIAADFAAMHQLGVTVVRTWFFQSFIAARDWSAFDRVLAAAGRNGIRVIPVLSNQWGSCENFNHTQQAYKTLAWYRSGYANQADYGMAMPYADYAYAVAQRYAGDHRVAFWQLMNEAEAEDSRGGSCQEQDAANALRSFADRMTAIVKAADAYHLVSLGTTGEGHCGLVGDDYQYVHAGAVDMCEYHDYAAVPDAAPRSNPCAGLQKPTFAGERGFTADLGSGAVTSGTLAQRARYFASDIQAALGSDASQGYLIWSWSEGRSVSFDVGKSDPAAGVLQQGAALASPEAVYLAVSTQ